TYGILSLNAFFMLMFGWSVGWPVFVLLLMPYAAYRLLDILSYELEIVFLDRHKDMAKAGCGILRGLRREPPPPPQPRFGASAGGAGSRRSPPPGRQHYRSVRSRMPVLSAIIFDALLRASDPKMPAAPSAVHNCLVGGSSPPSL